MGTLQTTDIGLAAAIMVSGAKLEWTDKDDPRHMVFHFAGDNLKEIEIEWANGSPLFKFYEALKSLKGVVHSR